MKIIASNVTNSSAIFVTDNGQTFAIDTSHPNFKMVVSAYKKQNFDEILGLLDIRKAVSTVTSGRVTVVGEQVLFDNEPAHGYLVDRILHTMREGLPFKHFLAFLGNLKLNPSKRAVDELYQFLDSNNGKGSNKTSFPITEDGCFLAYKGVQNDFWSITGGKIRILKGKVNAKGQVYNGVGEYIECVRNDVDDDKNRTCSDGLHVGSYNYASDFRGSGKLVVVKVNPKDVVSVPVDHNCQKLRTCAYEVLSAEERILSDVRDVKYDRVAKARQARLANGQFAPKAKTGQKRDSNGRFVSQ